MPREDEGGVHHSHDGRLAHILCSHRDLHDPHSRQSKLFKLSASRG